MYRENYTFFRIYLWVYYLWISIKLNMFLLKYLYVYVVWKNLKTVVHVKISK